MAKTNSAPKTPEVKKDERPTLKQAFKEIGTAGGVTVFLITTLSSFSLPGILSTLLQGSFSLDAAGIELLIQMIRLTAPLTLGILIIALAIIRGWVDEGYPIVLLTSAVLVATTLLLREDGQSIIATAWKDANGNVMVSFPLNLLIQYFRIYFWIPFVSSFIIGLFLSWAINRLLDVKTISEP